MRGLFPFEEEEGLAFVPLAARRALDRSGVRVSLEGWRSLSEQARARLVELGAAAEIDGEEVRTLVAPATPEAKYEPSRPDPDSQHVPERVRKALGPTRPVTDERWQELDFLMRFALDKLAERDRAGRLDALWRALVG